MSGKIFSVISAVLLVGQLCVADSMVVDVVFVAFDTETTGFSRDDDRLVEIGAVKFRGDGEVLGATNWLVNPQRDIPVPVSLVHGITTDMVSGAPVFAEIWAQFSEFCGDAVLLAHNATFDVGFLQAELVRAGLDAPAIPVVDTLPLFRKWFPRESSHSLGTLTESLGVPGETYHRAEADSFHIANVFRVGVKTRQELTMRRFELDAGGFKWLNGRVQR